MIFCNYLGSAFYTLAMVEDLDKRIKTAIRLSRLRQPRFDRWQCTKKSVLTLGRAKKPLPRVKILFCNFGSGRRPCLIVTRKTIVYTDESQLRQPSTKRMLHSLIQMYLLIVSLFSSPFFCFPKLLKDKFLMPNLIN